MDEVEVVHEAQRVEALLGDAPQPRQREVRLAARLAVVPRELVEVVAQQLAHDEEVLLVVEEVEDVKHVVRVGRVVVLDVLQLLAARGKQRGA